MTNNLCLFTDVAIRFGTTQTFIGNYELLNQHIFYIKTIESMATVFALT